MSDKKRIFDEWEEVDCNNCESYWINQCNGVGEAQERPCTAFKATRSVVIPQQIKWLKTRLKWLYVALGLMGIVVIGLSIIILKYYFEGI